MATLDVEDGFSIHDYRHGFKLLRQDGDTTVVENREGFACPVCGEEFDRLLATERSAHSFSSRPPGPICVGRAGEQLLVLTH